MTKRILRIRGCIYFDSDKWTEEDIVKFLEEKVGMYSLVVASNMNLQECPAGWQPKQKTLNGLLKFQKSP